MQAVGDLSQLLFLLCPMLYLNDEGDFRLLMICLSLVCLFSFLDALLFEFLLIKHLLDQGNADFLDNAVVCKENVFDGIGTSRWL